MYYFLQVNAGQFTLSIIFIRQVYLILTVMCRYVLVLQHRHWCMYLTVAGYDEGYLEYLKGEESTCTLWEPRGGHFRVAWLEIQDILTLLHGSSVTE